MKKIIFLLLISLWGFNTFGQDYYPLVQENKKWSVAFFGDLIVDDMSSTQDIHTFQLTILGDSVINDKTYFKVCSGSSDRNVKDYIREDSDKKVWLLDNNQEILLYDFSANVGDTIPSKGGYDMFSLIIDSITNVTINQTVRRKYWLSPLQYSYEYSETWIEGIGSSKGLLNSSSMGISGGSTELLCMHNNEDLVYMNPAYNTCDTVSKIKEENKKLSFVIYPNPAKNIVQFKNIPPSVQEVEVYDIAGKLIKKTNLNETQILNIEDLKQGVYLVKANKFVQKLIKQ